MTSIFAYPIQNGWVIASDKLETNQNETQRRTDGDETTPVDVITKVKRNGRYVYSMAGISQDIEKIEQVLLNSMEPEFKLDKFRQEILAVYGKNLSELDVEILVIDSQKIKAYKISINGLPDKLAQAEIKSIEDGYIGSGAKQSEARYHTTPTFASLNNVEIITAKSRKLKKLLNKTISGLEILARADYQFTDHPAVYGANIIVVTKSKILECKVLPKKYVYKESKQRKWLELE